MRNLLIISIFVCLLIPSLTFAEQQVTNVSTQETKSSVSWPRIDVGAGYWWTQSNLDMKLYASEPWVENGIMLANTGDKVSELNNELDSGLFVVNAEAYLFWKLYVDGFIGWNSFEGKHKDSDWLPQYDTSLMQFSESDANGNIATWNANAYIRLIDNKDKKGYLDFGLGYFYYRDNIEHIENSTISVLNWETVNIPIPGHDSSDDYKFDGFRICTKAMVKPHERVAIKFAGGIVPWLSVSDNKFWNLRDDFGEPAGLTIKGDADGFAFDFNVALEIKILQNFYIEGGYKYISLSATDGNLKWRWDARPDVESDADSWDVDAGRGGFYAMGRIKI
jgi:hypothetical protein